MDPIDLICESCGETNRPGTRFCTSCNNYLDWNRGAGSPPGRTGPGQPTGTVANATVGQPPPSSADAQTQAWGGDPAWTEDGTPTDPGAGGWGSGPVPSDPYADPYAGPGGYEERCPNCHTANPPQLRFCSRCGYGFAASMPAAPGAAAFGGNAAASDRTARRSYRRSLPPLYRWRRVAIGGVVVALLLTFVVVARQDPVGLVRSGWYALNGTYVKVDGVQAAIEPADQAVAGSDPVALVDSSVREFSLRWEATAESACGPAPGTGEIVLRLPQTRIRRLQILPGLDKSNPQRTQQPLPRAIGITFDDGVCHPVTLTNADVQPVVGLDSGIPTSTVRIGVGSVYPSGAGTPAVVSFTEIVLQAFPR